MSQSNQTTFLVANWLIWPNELACHYRPPAHRHSNRTRVNCYWRLPFSTGLLPPLSAVDVQFAAASIVGVFLMPFLPMGVLIFLLLASFWAVAKTMKVVAVVVDHFELAVDRRPGPGDLGSMRARGLSVGVLEMGIVTENVDIM